MNTKSLVPPKSLIIENGIGIGNTNKILEEFVLIGEGIIGNMIQMELIKSNSTVLDVGCGLGRLSRSLVKFLTTGEYYGLDATKSSIVWCDKAYNKYDNFHFHFADVFSNTYNTKTSTKPSQYKFPYIDEKFDFLWSTSLFTHMMLDDFENYIKEMSRVMKKGAKCWNTYLLLDQFALDQLDKINAENKRYYLPYQVDGGYVRNLSNPEAQIALYENKVKTIHEKYGLNIIEIRYGPWCGRTENIKAGGQDIVIAQKM